MSHCIGAGYILVQEDTMEGDTIPWVFPEKHLFEFCNGLVANIRRDRGEEEAEIVFKDEFQRKEELVTRRSKKRKNK
jgi:hypothetical protein